MRYVRHLAGPHSPQSDPSWMTRYLLVIFLLTPFHPTLGLYILETFRGGAGPRGALSTLSQYMLSSAATFGFFLSIGSVSPFHSPPTASLC